MRHSPRSFAKPLLRRCSLAVFLLFLLSIVSAASLLAQSPATSAQQPGTSPAPSSVKTPDASQNTAEVTTRDTPATFKVRVNLVLVRVVVRDDQGKVIENLKKEDFQIFDNRKPQTISTFSMETPSSHNVSVFTVSEPPDADSAEKSPAIAAAIPQRFVSLLFDDLHLPMEDAINVRVAAGKIFDSLAASDRVAIFTASGQFAQEFTS